jgi:hypothetical protein
MRAISLLSFLANLESCFLVIVFTKALTAFNFFSALASLAFKTFF